jgi:hypothetical protein
MNGRMLQCLTVLGIILMPSGRSLAAQDGEPIIGTWVLNVALSTFSPGSAPQTESRTYVLEGQATKVTSKGTTTPMTYMAVRQEIKATSTMVGVDGKTTTREWTIVYDGKERPVTGDPDVETLASRRVDAFTTEFTQRRAGRIVNAGTQVISRDGNVMTITSEWINARGQTISSVSVFERMHPGSGRQAPADAMVHRGLIVRAGV